jgi:beta-lactamase class A
MRRWAAIGVLALGGCAAPSEFERMGGLERRIRLEAGRLSPGVRVSLWLGRPDGRERLALDADREVPAAGLVAVLVLVEGFAREREGSFRWSGEVTEPETGRTSTYRDLGRRMISEGDLRAMGQLLSRLGRDAVNARARALGMERTTIREDPAANTTTAREMGVLLGAILRGAVVSREASAEMAAMLERTSRGRIASGLPRDLPVGHKAGVLPGCRHDAGWVRRPERPYVLCIFLDNVLESADPKVERGWTALEAAARRVHEEMGPTEE